MDGDRGLRADDELLLALSRNTLEAHGEQRIRDLLVGPLSLAQLCAKADYHRVSPRLLRSLERFNDLAPARSLGELLAPSCRSAAQRNLWLGQHLCHLVSALRSAGIDVLTFKGPTLSVLAYSDVGVRDFGDLDLLVEAHRVDDVVRVLMDIGYRRDTSILPCQNRFLLKHKREISLRHADHATTIDLHTELMPAAFYYPVSFSELNSRAQHVQLSGGSVPTLSREDLLLYLCAHGTRHDWTYLGWIVDIAQLASIGIDWNTAVRQSERLRATRMFCLAMILAKRLLALDLPQPVQDLCGRHKQLPHLVELAARHLLSGKMWNGWQSVSFQTRVRDARWDGWRYGFNRTILPSADDWNFIHLPPSLQALYYALRPFRLAGAYLRGGTSQK
jgi:hypothetical protein